MIGDALSDIQAGQAFGLKTLFIAAHKCDICQRLLTEKIRPALWADDLWSAAHHIV